MGRDPRHVPPGYLFEVTTRTVQSRLLLRPSRELNEIIIGILGQGSGDVWDASVCHGLALKSLLCGAPHSQCYVQCLVMW